MVAMVAGMIVSAAVLMFFFSSMKSNGEYVQSTRLTQELRNTLDLFCVICAAPVTTMTV